MKFTLLFIILTFACTNKTPNYVFKGQISLRNGEYKKAFIRYYRTWLKDDEMQTVDVGIDGRFEIEFESADQYYYHFLHEGYPEEDFYFNMEKPGTYELNILLDKARKPDNFNALLLTSLSNFDINKAILMEENKAVYEATLSNISTDVDTVFYEVTNNLNALIKSKLFTQKNLNYALVQNGKVTITFDSKEFYTDMNRSKLKIYLLKSQLKNLIKHATSQN